MSDLTREAIIEAMARDICAKNYGLDPDELVDSLRIDEQEPLWTNFVAEAQEQLDRVGKLAAVVPRNANTQTINAGLGETFDERDEDLRCAYRTMVRAADLTQERT